jgi:methionine-gamma-lyase
MKEKHYSPESLMMSYGYDPHLSEGAVKCPIFMTSTFVFKTAEEGKAFFEIAYGQREKRPRERMGLIYSRLNNPDLEILENRLTLWDGAEDAAVFESGMSAISTVLMEFLKPGDVLLYSNPVYGGTHHFIHTVLTKWGVRIIGFGAGHTQQQIEEMLVDEGLYNKLAMIYIETPANPTNDLIDIEMCARIAQRFSTPDKEVLVTVDNTYMGPLWQHPLQHGAHLVLYSATKYIGGHSDVIAGAVLGSEALMKRVKTLRTFLGNMCSPHTGWLLMRSLETLKVRMQQQALNARKVAEYLRNHPKVEKVYYLGLIDDAKMDQQEIYTRQCLDAGAMISFDIAGGEAEAFQFLNNLKHIKLAVSLGGTESLAEHPYTMTHADVPAEEKHMLGITENMIRLSVGIENCEDLIDDLTNALETVEVAVEA